MTKNILKKFNMNTILQFLEPGQILKMSNKSDNIFFWKKKLNFLLIVVLFEFINKLN